MTVVGCFIRCKVDAHQHFIDNGTSLLPEDVFSSLKFFGYVVKKCLQWP